MITRWDCASENHVSKWLPLFIEIQINWKKNLEEEVDETNQTQFESVYQNVNELENEIEKGVDETHQRQFESVLGGYKGSEWCHNEVGGQATTIANYLQSMPSICRVSMRMSCEKSLVFTQKLA